MYNGIYVFIIRLKATNFILGLNAAHPSDLMVMTITGLRLLADSTPGAATRVVQEG